MNNVIIRYLKDQFKDSFDVIYREISTDRGTIYVVYIDNMCDSKFISEYIVAPLVKSKIAPDNIEAYKQGILVASSIGDVKTKKELLTQILSGNVLIVFSFLTEVIYCEAKGFSKRGITVPTTEAQIKGPREGFNEAINDNLSLVRRRIRDSSLKFENMRIGNKTQTIVVLAYIENTAPDSLVNYIRGKLESIDTEALLSINYIEELLKSKRTAFDTIGYTEKPDVVASRLCEGKVAILVDGTPFVITAPYFFVENFQTGDDYYSNKYFANITRILRWFAFLLSTLLTAFYIALVTHHFSLIPYMFTFRLAISRAGVPFPTIIEVFLMMFFFQLSREAGIRLPQPIGQAMSIVGSLILGDATVGSGLASQTTLIIVAVSSICSFLIPKLYGAITIWNVAITIFASMLGLPGFYIGFCIFVTHLAGLDSCGYPYLFPLGTLRKYKNKDTLIRANLNEITNNILKEDEKNAK